MTKTKKTTKSKSVVSSTNKTVAKHKPIMLSAIQPSNKLTLGNYLGAMKPYVQTASMFDMYVFVADLHAITNKFDPESLSKNRKEAICTFYACGLDFSKLKIFFQSDVKSHTELAHVLSCHTTIGELKRMTQFKDKAKKAAANGTDYIPTGLLMYPVLMVADILLYDANAVIVGADQKQHLELTRNVAERMNNKYATRNGGKPLFVLPEPYILKTGAKIMDLQDPSIKMSKSNANPKGTIFIMDPPEIIADKIKKAKTDSLNKVKYDKVKQPGVSNLIEIYCALTGMSQKDVEETYADAENYGVFKNDLIKIVCSELSKLQERYREAEKIYNSKILPILKANAEYCTKICQKKTEMVYKAIGMD